MFEGWLLRPCDPKWRFHTASMIGLVFGLEKNVCGYILIYTDSQSCFWWVCPWTTGVGGGYGVGDCTMDPGLGQKCVPSLKNTSEFLVHSKQGKGQKVVG